MEIRVLRYFLTVAREENITKAAEVLHITQPALSRQLAQLEEELGVKLFDRGTRKITLTDEGMLLRRRGEEIVQLVAKTENELIEQERLLEGKITIGCGEMAAVTLLPDLFRSFHQKYPHVTFDLLTETADIVKEQMDKGLVDIGLLLEPIDVTKYDYVRLDRQDTWGLLVRDDHPLAKKASLTAEDAASCPLLLPLRESIRAEILHWLGREENDLKIPLFYTLLSNAALMVAEGLGCAFCMDGALAIRSDPRLRFIPLEPRHMTHSVLVWKKNNLFSSAASLFIQEINMLRAQIA